MFAKEIGELGGRRHSSHIRLGISQHPLDAFVIVRNSDGHLAQQDHVARVARQLLWGEEFVNVFNFYCNQRLFAKASQPKKRLSWVTAWAAHVIGDALPFTPRRVGCSV